MDGKAVTFLEAPRIPCGAQRLSWADSKRSLPVFYRKNVFAWEQAVRIVAGIAMIGGGLAFVPGWPGYLAAAAGAYTALTGVFGYCPACAMVGRKPIDTQ
jgi:hypothetical protein